MNESALSDSRQTSQQENIPEGIQLNKKYDTFGRELDQHGNPIPEPHAPQHA